MFTAILNYTKPMAMNVILKFSYISFSDNKEPNPAI